MRCRGTGHICRGRYQLGYAECIGLFDEFAIGRRCRLSDGANRYFEQGGSGLRED